MTVRGGRNAAARPALRLEPRRPAFARLGALAPLLLVASLLVPTRAAAQVGIPRAESFYVADVVRGVQVYVSTHFPNGQVDILDSDGTPYWFVALDNILPGNLKLGPNEEIYPGGPLEPLSDHLQ